MINKYESEKQAIFFTALEGDPDTLSAAEETENYEDNYSVPSPKLYEVFTHH